MDGKVIEPSPASKLLGVVFNHELRWKEHVQQAVKQATKVNIALGGLRQLLSEQIRQLYQACVTPVLDYTSTVRHDPLRDKTHLRLLGTVQQAALVRIMSSFKTVTTSTLEVEAYVLPTHLRLRHQAQSTIARLHTLPQDHPVWSTLSRAQKRRNNTCTAVRFRLAEALKTIKLERLDRLETIDPRPLPPWRPPAFEEIEIERDRDAARERASAVPATSDITVYSDASGRQGHLGAAAVTLNKNLEITEFRQTQVGPMNQWSVHAAELIDIFHTISLVVKLAHQTQRTTTRCALSATILCDSISALQAVQNPGNKPGQRITYAILQAATEARARGITLGLQWIPGHCDDPGNDAADQLAKKAATPGKTHPFRPLLSREKTFIRNHIRCQWEQEWKTSKKAGHSWLATYRKTFGFREDDQYAYDAQETVVHVLVDCPLLKIPRQELQKKVRDAFNSLSVLLGGREGKERQVNTASRASIIEAVLGFAEASQRFRSRAPIGQPNSENGS